MAKRITKAQLLLQDARNKRDAAKNRAAELFAEYQTANAVALAFSEVYDGLEKSLAPKPRKQAEKKNQPALQDVSKVS